MCKKLIAVVCFVSMLAVVSAAYADLPEVIPADAGWLGDMWGRTVTVTPVGDTLKVCDFPAGWGPTIYLPVGTALGAEGLEDFSQMTDLHLDVSVVKSEWDLGDYGWMNIFEDVILQSDASGWRQLGGAADCSQLVGGVWVPVTDIDPATGESGIKGRQSELWWDDPEAWVDGVHTLHLDLKFDATGYGLTYANIMFIAMDSGAARGMDIAPVPLSGQFYFNNITMTPEPATIALLGLGGLALLRRKHA
ncbi:MAG: PEP-CTERM sorting domain-containing protein [Sedimentisphaerales bacterium]